MFQSKLLLVVSAVFLLSCGVNNQRENDGKSILGNYGHLEEIESYKKTNMFLFHIDKGESFRVCIPNQIKNDLPEIENEIVAAINIWAYYLKRKIDVQLSFVDINRDRTNTSLEKTFKEYKKKCPVKTDLMVGLSNIPGNQSGQLVGPVRTSTAGDGKLEVLDFDQALFLGKINGRTNKKQIWKTLKQATGQSRSADEILDLLIKRSMSFKLSNSSEALTLMTIIHEVGHIWGLCDQYPLAGGATNCDPRYSTTQLNADATMANRKTMQHLYLTDDDIMGIQEIGRREGFQHSWPAYADYSTLQIPAIQLPVVPVIENVGFYEVSKSGVNVRLNLTVYINAAFKLQISYFDSRASAWVAPYDWNILADPNGARIDTYDFGVLPLNHPDYSKIRVTFQVIDSSGADVDAPVVIEHTFL